VIKQNKPGEYLLRIKGNVLTENSDRPLAADQFLNVKLTQLPAVPSAKAIGAQHQNLNTASNTLPLSNEKHRILLEIADFGKTSYSPASKSSQAKYKALRHQEL
jgi:hypothetical protein